MSLGPSFAWMEHADHLVQLVDTPGAIDLVHERQLASAACDGAIVVISSFSGVAAGGEMALADLDDNGVPALAVVNKIDRHCNLPAALAGLHRATRRRVVALGLPLRDGHEVVGVVQVLEGCALRYAPDGSGACSREPIPERMAAEVAAAREQVMETVALTDDALLEQYLEFLELPLDVVRAGLAKAVQRCEVLPVFLFSATSMMGADPLLDAVVSCIPSPADRTAPFITEFSDLAEPDPDELVAQLVASRLDVDNEMYHVLRIWNGSVPDKGVQLVNTQTGEGARLRKLYQLRGPRRRRALYAQQGGLVATWDPLPGRPGDTFTSRRRLRVNLSSTSSPMCTKLVSGPMDGNKLRDALQLAVRLDAGLRLASDEVSGGLLLQGMSAPHLDYTVRRIQERFGVKLGLELPPVGYREMPVLAAMAVEGLHRRIDADGLNSEFAECHIDVMPQGRPDGLIFRPEGVEEDDVPERFRPSIDQGVRRGVQHGPLAGYPVVGLDIRLVGGEYDIFQSTDDHFVLAAENAVKNALERTGTCLLEPVCAVDVWTPAEVGGVISDIRSNRGRIVGMEVEEGWTHIMAQCPYRELRTFESRLRALSHGRARWRFKRSHYEPVPVQMVGEIVAKSPFRQRSHAASAK
jgi:elongation factor G